jgi:predicted permease
MSEQRPDDVNGLRPDATSESRPASRGDERRAIERDADAEIAFHLDMRIRELRAMGYSADAARREALRRFGDVRGTRAVIVETNVRMERRSARKEWWSEVVQDARMAVRQLRRRPGFALVAVWTLAIGIGASTAIFSAADHVLLRPLPYVETDRVVRVFETDRRTGEDRREAATANFLSWRERQRTFSAIALAEPSGFDMMIDGRPEPVDAWMVTEGYFEALGVRPMLGRGFVPEEHNQGLAEDDAPLSAAMVVVISHGLWRNRFGGDPGIVGSTIELDGAQRTIVGVLPPSLDYPHPVDVWAPKIFREYELEERTGGYMEAVARLAPGSTLEAAQRDMDRIAAELAAEYPTTNAGFGVNLVPLEDHLLGGVRPALWALLGAVVLVLLIACANVASLLLARRTERERELAVRSAIGAGRSRLLRQLLTENIVLALLGGVFGLLLATGAVQVLVAMSPPDLPQLDTIRIDARVLLFALAVTLATGLLFGLAPAWQFSQLELQPGLGWGTRAVGGGARNRLRRVLVAGEIAIALVLLIGAGLLGRSFLHLLSNDVGFGVANRAAIQFSLEGRAATPEELIVLAGEHRERLAAVPDVEDVAMVSALPFHPIQIDNEGTFEIEGMPLPAGVVARAQTTIASPNYFRVMGIPVRGRAFTDRDRRGAPDVAIINETLARSYFGAENPIGKRVTIGVMSAPRTREIVGVVGDVRPTTLDSDPRAELYVPFEQRGYASMTYVVQTHGSASAIVPRLREAVWATDPLQTINHSDTLERMVADTLIERRFHLLLLGTLSLVAFALSVIGVYGLIRFVTEQRRAEIGLRMALGARRADVTRMIVSDAIRLVLPGIAVGTLGALALTRFLRALLYGITPTDPATFAQLAAAMLVVAVAAALLPAVRAASTDPMHVLRQE